jgi:hypothetical protein
MRQFHKCHGLEARNAKINRLLLIGLTLLIGGLAFPAYAQANKEQYELQERCGKRAAEVFKNDFPEGSVTNTKDGQMVSSFQNHYNARLNKCFYLTSSLIIEYRNNKKGTTTVLSLYDINDNNEYASFTGKPNEPFALCVVRDRVCSSEKEWRQLIKPYIEE